VWGATWVPKWGEGKARGTGCDWASALVLAWALGTGGELEHSTAVTMARKRAWLLGEVKGRGSAVGSAVQLGEV
jgi:hypothetical protein